jgi:hypothetical protein
MSRSVELPDSDFERLEGAAEGEGVTPAEWIARRIPRRADPLLCADGTPARTMADAFAGRIGRFSSGEKERLSGREVFGEMLAAERRAGDSSADVAETNHLLEVPESIYTAIEEEAGARGLAPLAWIVAQLPPRRPDPATNVKKPVTMAERLAGRVGLFSGSKGLPSSDNVAQSFAEYLEAKQREGRL